MCIRDKIKQLKLSRLPEHEKYLLSIINKTKKEKKLLSIFSNTDNYFYNDMIVFSYVKSKNEFSFDNHIIWYPILELNSTTISSRNYYDYIIDTLRCYFNINITVNVTNRDLNKNINFSDIIKKNESK